MKKFLFLKLSTKKFLLSSLRAFFGPKRGLTLIELLVFSAIFAIVMAVFISVLVSTTRIQAKQYALAEVNNQSLFILRTIERLVAQSSLVDIPAGVTTSSLKLRMADSSSDPTYIYLSGGVIYVKYTDGGSPEPLNSSRVNVASLSFAKRPNSPGHDSVNVSFTVEYGASNIQHKFAQALDTTVARVSAATFDSNLIPSSTATYNLGVTGQIWNSVNNIIYFSGSNVGIGVSNPAQTLEINGGLRLNTTATKPTCSSSQRGTFWVTQSGAGVKDAVEVCVKNASDTYSWFAIY